MTIASLKRAYQETILEGMAGALWGHAWQGWAGDSSSCVYCGSAITRESPAVAWVDRDGGEVCPDYDDGDTPGGGPHTPQDPEEEDVVPATPHAALLAARDLAKLYAKAEGLDKEKSAMADLFEVAMQIHQGEFQFEDDTEAHAAADEPTQADHATNFGIALADMALGTGGAWGDHYRTERGGTTLQLTRPAFEIHYDGEQLQWEGGALPARAQGEDTTEMPAQIGRITVINPNDANFYEHSYVLAIGAYGESLYLVYADGLDSAFDEMVDWAADNAPGLLSEDYYQEEFKRLEAEEVERLERRLDDDELVKIQEQAEADLSIGGNNGLHYTSHEWNYIAEDPTRHQLLDIAFRENPPRPAKTNAGSSPPVGDAPQVGARVGFGAPGGARYGIVVSTQGKRIRIRDEADGSMHTRLWVMTFVPNAGVGAAAPGAMSPDVVRSIVAARTERCSRGCPGWAVFDGDHIEACDECNSYARDSGARTVTDDDVAGLPEAQRALQRELAQSNPATLTAKGKRMYKAIEKGYRKVGETKAKEVAARTVLSRARQGGRGLVKTNSPVLRCPRRGPIAGVLKRGEVCGGELVPDRIRGPQHGYECHKCQGWYRADAVVDENRRNKRRNSPADRVLYEQIQQIATREMGEPFSIPPRELVSAFRSQQEASPGDTLERVVLTLVYG